MGASAGAGADADADEGSTAFSASGVFVTVFSCSGLGSSAGAVAFFASDFSTATSGCITLCGAVSATDVCFCGSVFLTIT